MNSNDEMNVEDKMRMTDHSEKKLNMMGDNRIEQYVEDF